MKSKLKGKKLSEPVAITYCDFNQPGRRQEIVRHYSIAAAMRRYPDVWDSYQSFGKVWVEKIEKKEVNSDC